MDHLWILGPAVFLPLGIFICITAIVIVPLWLRSQERMRMHETLRRLQDAGHPATPELLEILRTGPVSAPMARFNSPEGELRRGLILIAVALAMVLLGLAITAGDRVYEPIWPIIGAAAFPFLIGVASLIMWKITSARGV